MRPSALTHSVSDRAPQKSMAGLGARGEHNGQILPANVLALSFKRQEVKDQISILRHRHRKRKRLLRLLRDLTTQQLRAEVRFERQQRKLAS